ncbi:carbohydrate ABC transporter permease [Clostridium swellfunianum]|uniref:carbohydrate ABC transporter permease n=1 Tax=Clostridium swellfunianum TaxID=1367462 RepID=UPI00202FB997|nr:carbohydrate ABC transporter permease [Clostridium swellfunianum]MCM0649581.1 carbohydrate ABC transporter permease [Clostridium swellfunianum]
MKAKNTTSDKVFLAVTYITLILLTVTILYPLLQVITISLSSAESIYKPGMHIIPTDLDFSGYKIIFKKELIWTSYRNTIVRTVIGTAITVFLTFLGAYTLSKKTLPHRKFWTGFVTLTMFFSGGMIPSYLLVVKVLNINNTIWSLVLPGAINTFYLIVTRNFIAMLPESLEESAKIEGANDIYILFKIIMPLSMPILTTVALYTMVYHWNAWFDCMMYIQNESKYVLQLVLRRIILEGADATAEMSGQVVNTNLESMKMATLVVAILPIICVYPFLQKYFVQGMLVGSVKG